MRRAAFASLILILIPALASCHWLLPLKESAPDTDTASAADSVPLDRGEAVLPRSDLMLDQGFKGVLKCQLPQRVNDMVDKSGNELALIEPAMQADHNTLVARCVSDSKLYHAIRTSTGFAVWKPWPGLSGREDPSFYERDGIEYAMVAYRESPTVRVLQQCTVGAGLACTKLTLTPAPPGTNWDGPDMREQFFPWPFAEEVVFAAEEDGKAPDLHLGSASTPNPTSFQVTPLAALNTSAAEDDPAVTPEGLFLVFTSDRQKIVSNGGQLDLWVAYRLLGLAYELVPSPEQDLFQAVNSQENDAAPDLVVTSTGIELYFHSDRGGTDAIYRAACWLE